MSRIRVFALVALLALLPATVRAANGIIAGTVTRTDNQQAITSGTAVLLAASDFSLLDTAPLNGNGQYFFSVAPGNYLVGVFAPTFAGELFDDVPCSDTQCDFEAATVLAVASGGLQTANFALDLLGSISGTVRRSDTNALVPGVSVAAFGQGPDPAAVATTDANGAYQLFVDDGSYSVRTRNTTTLLDEIWDDVPCNITGCNEGAATLIQVQNRNNVTGRNFVLAPGSPVSGHVTRSNAQPIDEFPSVSFADAQGNVVATAAVNFDGSWQLPIAATSGSWRAAILPGNVTRYYPQVYSGRACGGPGLDQCDIAAGTPIQVTVPAPVTNVDFALVRRTARLQGSVTELAGGQALADAVVTAYDADTLAPVASSGTPGGTPFILELDPGRYVLYAQGPLGPKPGPAQKHESAGVLLGEVYPGLQCFEAPPNCTSPATVLDVAADQDLAGLDFALAPAGHVMVSLKNENTSALMDGQLKILHPGTTTPLFQFVLTPAITDVPVLNGGSLRLAGAASACGPLGNRVCRAERNDGGLCVGLACDLTLGTGIPIAKGGDGGSVELLLQPGRRAGGFVRTADGQAGISGVTVEFSIGDVKVAQATSGGDGSYEIGGLGGVPYFARTRAPSGFLDELYQELPCPPGQCTFSTGTSFVAPADTDQVLNTVNFTLAPGASIRGTVTNALTTQAVGEAQVSVFNGSGVLVASPTSQFDGSYATQALPPGNYFLFAGRTGFLSELYQEASCPGNVCTPLDGAAVAVVAANDTQGVDFTLTPDASRVPPTRKIFLNRCASPGCVVNPGPINSSITNTSTIVASTRTVSSTLTDAEFSEFAACVKDMYAPFNAEVVTVDPGNVPHQEVMIADTAAQVGQPSSVGGVSPWSCGDVPNAIVFAIALDGIGPQRLCETAAQELGHSFGLDHEYLCEDPMTYLEGCGAKHYQDVDAPCGEQGPRQCECGSLKQNSYRRLLADLGPTPAIFQDGFESQPAAKPVDDAAKVFGPPLDCGSVFTPDPSGRPDDRIPVDRRR